MSKEINKLRYASLEKALEILRGSNVLGNNPYTLEDTLKTADEVYAWLTKDEINNTPNPRTISELNKGE